MRIFANVMVLFLITGIGMVCGQRSAYNLKQDLFRIYNSQARPVKNSSSMMDICVGLFVLQIVDVHAKSQVIQANIQFRYVWNDSFMIWNPEKYGNVSQLYVKSSTIWTPDIIIMDTPEEKFSKNQKENYLLIVSSSGLVKWQFQTIIKSFCEIDIMNFPFDEQRCSIIIRSSGRDKSMIRMIRRNFKVKVKETIKTEWFITDSSVEEDKFVIAKNQSDPIEYSALKFNLILRRVTIFYFLKILIPFTVITSVTLFTFWLAPDSSEKLTLNATVLLSLVIYLQIISDYVPRGFSKLPLLTIFSLTNFCLVYLSSSLSVFILRLYYKGPSFLPPVENQVPYIVRLVLFKYLGPAVMIRFYFRKKDELFSTLHCMVDNTTEISQLKKLAKQNRIKRNTTRKNEVNFATAACEFSPTSPTANVKTPTKGDYLQKIVKLDKNDDINTLNDDLSANKRAVELLACLKLLSDYTKRVLVGEKSSRDNKENIKAAKSDDNPMTIKSLYLEEWKQAALILDRLFFVLFSILMPLTSLFFFKTDFLGYIKSQTQNANVPNFC